MAFEPTHSGLFGLAVQHFNCSAILSNHRSFIGNLNETNKTLKHSCCASNRMLLNQNKKNYQEEIKPIFDQK